MNKIWIVGVLFALIIGGGFLYNNFLNDKTDHMLELSEKAYDASYESMEDCEEYLDEIDERLESISLFLCAFIDRDIINEAKDAIVSAKGLSKVGGDECRWAINMMEEKIGHIKNTAQIKLKYML